MQNTAFFICAQTGVTPKAEGFPGCAKTATIQALAAKTKRQMYTLIGSLRDPADIGGYPYPGEIKLQDDQTGACMRLIPPSWAAQMHDGRPWMLFIDELTTCFPAGTLVELDSGEQIAIENVKPGTFVRGLESVNLVQSVSVKTANEAMCLETEDGRRIVATPEHEFYTQRGWVAMQDLVAGDCVLSHLRPADETDNEHAPQAARDDGGAVGGCGDRDRSTDGESSAYSEVRSHSATNDGRVAGVCGAEATQRGEIGRAESLTHARAECGDSGQASSDLRASGAQVGANRTREGAAGSSEVEAPRSFISRGPQREEVAAVCGGPAGGLSESETHLEFGGSPHGNLYDDESTCDQGDGSIAAEEDGSVGGGSAFVVTGAQLATLVHRRREAEGGDPERVSELAVPGLCGERDNCGCARRRDEGPGGSDAGEFGLPVSEMERAEVEARRARYAGETDPLSWVAIRSVEPVEFSGEVYDLSTWPNQNYRANGCVVHNCPPAVQAALLRVIAEKHVGDMAMPEGTWIVCASNPPGVAANGFELEPPMANRLCHLRWKMDWESWDDGMLSGLDFPDPSFPLLPEHWRHNFLPSVSNLVVAFRKRRPQLFEPLTDVHGNMQMERATMGGAWPSPRSWTNAAICLAAAASVKADEQVEYDLLEGCVGKSACDEFLQWRRQLDLPDPEELLKAAVLELAGKGQMAYKHPKRPDQVIAMLGAVTGAVVQKATVDRWQAGMLIVEKASEFELDVAVSCCSQLIKTKPVGAKLSQKFVKNIYPKIKRSMIDPSIANQNA